MSSEAEQQAKRRIKIHEAIDRLVAWNDREAKRASLRAEGTQQCQQQSKE